MQSQILGFAFPCCAIICESISRDCWGILRGHMSFFSNLHKSHVNRGLLIHHDMQLDMNALYKGKSHDR